MRPVLAILSVGLLSGLADLSLAGTRQLVWTVRVDQMLDARARVATGDRFDTQDLAFSPDDKRLAVVVAHSQLLIVNLASPEVNVQQFALSGTCGYGVTWNQRGDAILICGTLLRLADGARCDATDIAPILWASSSATFWLDSDHVVRSYTGEILDLACRPTGRWRLPPAWQIGAVAPTKGWVVLWREEGQRPKMNYQFSIVDRESHRTINAWPTHKIAFPLRDAMLAEGAEAWCLSLHDQDDLYNGRLHCREINSATEIPVPKKLSSYIVSHAATFSPRIIVEKWKQNNPPWWVFWVPDPGGPPLPVDRTVIDLRSGVVISSWKPRIQDSRSPYIEDLRFHCAISAHGEYVAESGDGLIELYRLPK